MTDEATVAVVEPMRVPDTISVDELEPGMGVILAGDGPARVVAVISPDPHRRVVQVSISGNRNIISIWLWRWSRVEPSGIPDPLARPCEGCGALPGEPCINLYTKVARREVHSARLKG